jgi:phenylalanyl-tRNA synthetase beta chain
MRVPLSWLQEYVDVRDVPVEALAERLTTSGLEVATIEYIGVPGPTSKLAWDEKTIKVGEIVAVEPHPNADRLRLVTIQYGADEPKTVVTGAPNVRVGQKVGYAMTGATVLNGYSEEKELITLEPKKLRGILSEGMVLSERELGLSDSHEGILDLPADAPVGASLQSYLGDIILDIELTPNLGRALSILGVAREVAALYNRPVMEPKMTAVGSGRSVHQAVKIEIRVPELNPRFTATLIRNIKMGESPAWMQRRLKQVGMRPISNIVDITNYVMMDIGQPLHAFDYDKLVERARASGADIPTIITRLAEPGETLTTLDGQTRTLRPDDILVCDTVGIISIAGIMGGAETEVSESTKNVLLEAAAWDYISTRRSSNRHLLFSEAAYRFGRGVHPAMASRGNLRAARMMAELCGGELAVGIVDEYPRPFPSVVVPLTALEVNRLLGTSLTLVEITLLLERSAFTIERQGDTLLVTVPDHRLDIAIPADLVEEVGRIYDLDNLPNTLIDEQMPPARDNRDLVLEERIKDWLNGAGLTETISYYLTEPDQERKLYVGAPDAPSTDESEFVRLANPSTLDRRVLRRTLAVSLVENLQTNLRHRDHVHLFEIGLVYHPHLGHLPRETRWLGIGMTGTRPAASWHGGGTPESDYYTVKGVIEELIRHLHLTERVQYVAGDYPAYQPGRCASILLDGEPIGVLGELHPLARRANDLPEQRIAMAEINLAQLLPAVPTLFKLVPVPRFPATMQDIAIIVPQSVEASRVESVIRRVGGAALTDVTLFDVYQGAQVGEGNKSLAYALKYSHPDKTYTDAEVAAVHSAIATALRTELGAKIRGEDA